MKYQLYLTSIILQITGLLFLGDLDAQIEKTQRIPVRKKSATEVKFAADIKWRALNPARGAASPQAGTVWGDQTKDGASGFLVKFIDGFSSPPHIHNITYRGIVIAGGLHNDDPTAEPMWMKPGSYWTQPAGEAHITSARGASVAYVEIQSGPYLVKPVAEAFDNGEKPVNVDTTNIVWLNPANSTWIQANASENSDKNPQIAFLWGRATADEINGTLLKLPSGFQGSIQSDSSTFKAVVIQGAVQLHLAADKKDLTAGSYFGSEGRMNQQLSCKQDCMIYIRTKGKYHLDSE